MTSFFGELRRRNVVRVAVAYAIVGWVLVEVSSVLLPAFEAPDWVLRVIVLLVGVGFVLALILSWAYDLTPQGVVRADEVPQSESITKVTGRTLDFVIIGVLAIAVAFFAVERFVLEETAETEIVADESVEAPPPVVVEAQRDVLPNSVAVLPFDNLSDDPENAFFAAGIHDEILNQLAKLSALNVIARTSMLRYAETDKTIPEIADELNVETVMEGSVRYAGNRVRITAQLVDPSTGAHLWSETYEREFDDIFAIESDIAMNIANALEAEFSLEEQEAIEDRPTDSLQAYELYLQALDVWNGGNPLERAGEIGAALSYLERAITFDPEFALAYVQKANNYGLMLSRDSVAPQAWAARRAELENLSRESAARALDLDPNLGAAHGVLGRIHRDNWRGVEAQDAFERALQLAPNDPEVLFEYGHFNLYTDRLDEAIALYQRVVDLRPNDPPSHHVLGNALMIATEYRSASSAYQRAIELNPTSALSYLELGRIAAHRGDYTEAIESIRTAEQLIGDALNTRGISGFAYSYSLAGSHQDALRMFNKLELAADDLYIDEQSWGQAYLAIGEYDQALRYFDATANNRIGNPPFALTNYIRVNAWNDPVLERPEFLEVRKRLGFADL